MRHSWDKKKLRQMISIAWQEMGWTRDQYEAWLLHVHNAELVDDRPRLSSLSLPQLMKAYADLERRGFRPKRAAGQQQAARKRPIIRKLNRLWLLLHANGQVHDGSEAAMQQWVVNNRKLRAFKWAGMRQLSDAVEALKDWCLRSGAELDAKGHVVFPDQREAG